MRENKKKEYSDIPSLSVRQRVFKLLDNDPLLKPKPLCKLMGLHYPTNGETVTQYRKQWKKEYKNRQALKCLSFHNARGWIYALKSVKREDAVVRGWIQTRAKNRMLLWKDRSLGRLEWHVTGRINGWIKKPVSWGKVKQLLANAFYRTELIKDIQIFDLWANSFRFKGAHLVYDTGERLPYAKIDYLKEALGIVVKTGDVTHPTSIEIGFHYPDWAERNEKLLEQNMKAMEQNSEAIKQFSEFLKGLSQPKPLKGDVNKMVI